MSKVLSGRRCGNTTRQVDEWIQQLFEVGEAIIIDHAHRTGNMSNRHAERILFDRLKNEHGLVVGKGLLNWDAKDRTLSLLPF